MIPMGPPEGPRVSRGALPKATSWQTRKKWLLSHKIETVGVTAICVAIVVILMSFLHQSSGPKSPNPLGAEPVPPPSIATTTATPTSVPLTPTRVPTLVPTAIQTISPEREGDLFKVLTLLSDPADFFDHSTPQFKAANWLISEDGLQLTSVSPNVSQRYALALLYFATGGGSINRDGWLNCSEFPDPIPINDTSVEQIKCIFGEEGTLCAAEQDFEACVYMDEFGEQIETKRFLSPLPECEWYGVLCDDLGDVVELRMDGNSLNGTLPTELYALELLTTLSLQSNFLRGTLPSELGLLHQLKHLLLSENGLDGTIPSDLYLLTNLMGFELDENTLTGSIDPSIRTLTNLQALIFSNNRLGGSLPTELGMLKELIVLTLFFNDFDSQLPSEIGQLSKLQHLFVHDCGIQGTLPSELGNLHNLVGLALVGNQLTGSLPSELYGLTTLVDLRLERNELTGTLSSAIGNLTSLETISFNLNKFHGPVPQELNLSNLTILQLQGNDFTGSIPVGLCNNTNGKTLFQADCLQDDNGNVKVNCQCCNQCCNDQECVDL